MIADLLTILDLTETDDGFLDHARRFADVRGAHLRVCVTASVRSTEYALAMGGGYPLNNELETETREKAAGVAIALKAADQDGDVICLSGETADLMKALTRQARASDLTLIGPPAAYGDRKFRWRTAEVLALTSGRPVMLMPRRGVADRIRHVVLGWNESREAVRALNDSLPLLEPDARIEVVAAGAGEKSANLDDICAHLRRLGYGATPHRLASKGEPSDLLLQFAREHHCDLLAVGAYGHNRLSEVFLGGVTRDLLDGGNVPILLSH